MTMEGQSVANVSWMFDHLVSLSWLVGGDKGLTILKASARGDRSVPARADIDTRRFQLVDLDLLAAL